MSQFFDDFSERLSALHDDIRAQLDLLPDAALTWEPGAEMNSIAILVTHTVGAERYWIGDVAGEEPSGRVRDEEFAVESGTVAELKALLDGATAYANGVLGRLTVDDFGRSHHLERYDRSFTTGWALLHALEHTAQHVGHIQQIRQLWEQHQQ